MRVVNTFVKLNLHSSKNVIFAVCFVIFAICLPSPPLPCSSTNLPPPSQTFPGSSCWPKAARPQRWLSAATAWVSWASTSTTKASLLRWGELNVTHSSATEHHPHHYVILEYILWGELWRFSPGFVSFHCVALLLSAGWLGVSSSCRLTPRICCFLHLRDTQSVGNNSRRFLPDIPKDLW